MTAPRDDTSRTRRQRWVRRGIRAMAVLLVLFAFYLAVIRPWHMHWGATSGEVTRPLPGDSLVQDPQEVTTRAITINAQPKHIWPWLAQMGNGRGGLYAYDWLDQLFGILNHASADTLLPRFQQLKAGDTIPIGAAGGWPVAVAIPNELLLLDIRQAGAHVTWLFALDSLSPLQTRLIMRVRAHLPVSWRLPFLMAALDPAEFLMVRRQLIGIRQRAESLARTDSSYVRAAA
jgi:hypothetical protein